MTTCDSCGATVGDVEKHQAWHDELAREVERVNDTATDALERAEHAQNVLYQNNIEV